jgi:uncharacterized membrane protein
MKIIYWCFAVFLLFFTAVMCQIIWPYFDFEYAYSFLGTKSDEVLASSVYMKAFYVHISSSVLAIFVGVFQFSSYLYHQKPNFHRLLGKIYVFSILILAAPSGLMISIHANGGLSSKVGFVIQSVLWFLTTLLALISIKKGDFQAHIKWTIRSYALTIAAMSLRTESYLMMYFLETRPIETYATVTWLSWVGNLIVAEILIEIGTIQRLMKAFLK